MQNFIAEKSAFTETTVTISGGEYHHATRSCRVRIGELIGITDGAGKRVEARIVSIDKNELVAEISEDVSGRGELSTALTVALALIKPSRFETAVEKCTELGARRFLPILTARTSGKHERINSDRLQRIALEAAKQSARSWLPEIIEPAGIMDLFDHTDGPAMIALQDAKESIDTVIKSLSCPESLAIIIGPEGDFTDEERDVLITSGAMPVNLGGLTLRSETAAIAMTAQCSACEKKSWLGIFSKGA